MPTDFIRQRHTNYTTPEKLLFDLVRQSTGDEPVHQEKIVRGYDNEVYVVTTDQQNDYIVRIAQHGEIGYTEEAWAIEQCRRAGVPVPALYYVGTLLVDDQPKPVMVQRRVMGRPLAEIQATLSQRELAHVYAQAGSVLSRIHSVPVGGFYKLQTGGNWDFPDWVSITQANLRDRSEEQPQLCRAGFTAREINYLLAIVADITPPTAARPVLCHGDFEAGHIFVDDELTITGVIDFGQFQGGLPLVDFVGLTLAHPEVDLAWLRAGYADPAVFADGFMHRLRHGQVSYLIGYLAHCIQIQDIAEVRAATCRLRTFLPQS